MLGQIYDECGEDQDNNPYKQDDQSFPVHTFPFFQEEPPDIADGYIERHQYAP
jgi:hypothetical protein